MDQMRKLKAKKHTNKQGKQCPGTLLLLFMSRDSILRNVNWNIPLTNNLGNILTESAHSSFMVCISIISCCISSSGKATMRVNTLRNSSDVLGLHGAPVMPETVLSCPGVTVQYSKHCERGTSCKSLC